MKKGMSKMKNVAIIGTGNISALHIKGLLKFPEKAKIVALVDIYPEKAEAKKAEFNLTDAQVFASHEEMLASGLKIDLIHNCTPPYVHAPISIDCMDKGINVVVEKPMATCLQECDEMIEASKRNNVMLAAIAQNRFQDPVNKLKQLADSGVAGKIRVAHVESFWWRGHSYYDLWWRGLWEKEGGGPTLNHAVHHIDMINWIQGDLPTEVTAVLANVMHDNSEVEDVSFGIMQYGDGSIGQVTSSVVHHGEEQGIILQCEDAKIASPFDVKAELSQGNGFPKTNTDLIEKITADYNAMPDLAHTGHAGQIDNVLTALINGTPTLITGEDGRKTVELISAIYKSGCEKKTVSLPLAKDDDFYTFEGILKNAVRFYEKKSHVENFAAEAITVGRYEENAK
jgi:predicted dehydrogenase